MYLIQTFVVTLSVDDPIQFASDADHYALLRAREVFAGRSYKGVHVAEVTAVARRSRLGIYGGDVVGQASVAVAFEARCSRLSSGDAHPAVRVRREAQVLMGAALSAPGASTEPLAASIVSPGEALADGAVVPVRIELIRYDPGLRQPTATARLLTCRTAQVLWRVRAASAEAVPERLVAQQAERLDAEVDAAAGIIAGKGDAASVRAFFAQLLHTYTRGEVPAAARRLAGDVFQLYSGERLLEAAALVPGSVWARPLEEPFDSTEVLRLSAAEAAALPAEGAERGDGPEVRDVTAQVAFTALTLEAIDAVRVLNGMAAVYTDQGLMERQIGVWRVMRAAQRN